MYKKTLFVTNHKLNTKKINKNVKNNKTITQFHCTLGLGKGKNQHYTELEAIQRGGHVHNAKMDK